MFSTTSVFITFIDIFIVIKGELFAYAVSYDWSKGQEGVSAVSNSELLFNLPKNRKKNCCNVSFFSSFVVNQYQQRVCACRASIRDRSKAKKEINKKCGRSKFNNCQNLREVQGLRNRSRINPKFVANSLNIL
jgi:hypothetical protein